MPFERPPAALTWVLDVMGVGDIRCCSDVNAVTEARSYSKKESCARKAAAGTMRKVR
jgi:hypothetical protein